MARKLATESTATHVAACAIQVGKRVIQRCMVCGEKLADTNYKDVSGVWGEGELVTAKLGFFYSAGVIYMSIDSEKKLPRDFCLSMVEL